MSVRDSTDKVKQMRKSVLTKLQPQAIEIQSPTLRETGNEALDRVCSLGLSVMGLRSQI